jgi:signal transduction histidine kinase
MNATPPPEHAQFGFDLDPDDRDRMAVLGQLASGLVHELKNPLGAISLNASMVMRQIEKKYPDDEKMRTRLQRISEATTALGQTIEGFLAFARPSKPDRDRIDIISIIDQILEQFTERLNADEITVQFSPSSDLKAVAADERHMSSVFGNIIANACDALRERESDAGRRIVILARNRNDRIVVVIANNGPALSQQEAAHLFDPFHSTKKRGTGLGLAIVQRLVELHGGSVFASSDPDQGVSFTVELPTTLGPARPRTGIPQSGDKATSVDTDAIDRLLGDLHRDDDTNDDAVDCSATSTTILPEPN